MTLMQRKKWSSRQTMTALVSVMAFAAFGVSSGAALPKRAPRFHSPIAASLQSSQQIDFKSAINGIKYRIRISIPQTPPPTSGYPVLYVLDGDGYFGLFSEEVLIRGTVAPEITPAVVVGIGYPTDDIYESLHRRVLDLTPTQDQDFLKIFKPFRGEAARVGGADAFLRVIKNEIEPRVAAVSRINANETIIWGHSLGGLFVLYTLFKHPAAFRTYVSLSPTLSWDHEIALAQEASFVNQLAQGSIAPRIFLSAGSRELGLPFDPKQPVRRWSATSEGTDDISALGRRLTELKGPPGYAASFVLFEGETHTSMPFASANAVVEFALDKKREGLP